MKVLRTSALALGYAARQSSLLSQGLSTNGMRLICLSNGHGEAQIAVRILKELCQLEPDWAIATRDSKVLANKAGREFIALLVLQGYDRRLESIQQSKV